jgi:hypothetical protein
MTNLSNTAERLADHFVSYLFDQYKGSRHVRRVASWIGFIIKAIERIAGSTLSQNRQRQITFEYKGRQFKAKYDHKAGPRGGIDIIEVLPGRGAPEGGTVTKITDLTEAEDFYRSPEIKFDSFIESST